MNIWQKALEVASHLRHPYGVIGVALVFAALVFSLALDAKRKSQVTFWMYCSALFVILLLGLAPLALQTYLQTRGVYRIGIEVLGVDRQPIRNAEITSLPSAQIKKTDGGWEVEIPPQTRPADGTVVLTASVEDSYVGGSSKVVLDKDYFPTVTIQLEPLPSVTVRGVVLDEHGSPVSGARVAVEGYSEVASTNEMGNFQVASHYANGQQVTIVAEKNGVSTRQSGPAGDGFELVLRKAGSSPRM